MKTQSIKQYLYTGDYYSYTLVTSADGTVTTKKYVTVPQQVSMSLHTNIFGELRIDSLYKMQRESYLKNVKDVNGEEIYENGIWEIISTSPILTAIGTKDGYQYVAQLISGDI